MQRKCRRFQVTKDIMKQQTLLSDNPRSMFVILLIKYDVIWTLPIIDCYIEDSEERSRLSNAYFDETEVCDLIDNKDDKNTIQNEEVKEDTVGGVEEDNTQELKGSWVKFRVQIMILLMKRSKKVN